MLSLLQPYLLMRLQKIGDVDCVCIGDASWEPCVAGVLAGLLGWPVIMEVDEVRRSDDEFVVVRRSGVGTQEIAVSGPVVLDVAARREEETKPGMRVVLAARKKPQETFSFDELNGSERTFEIEGYHDPEAVVSNVYDGTERCRWCGCAASGSNTSRRSDLNEQSFGSLWQMYMSAAK